jgi:lysophospholipase L1-like esterase
MKTVIRVVAFVFCSSAVALFGSGSSPTWVGTWACSPYADAKLVEPRPAAGDTLRQIVRVSIGGSRVRLRISNACGATALVLDHVHLAHAAGQDAIDPSSDRTVMFHGQPRVSVPAGGLMVSDPVDFPLAPRSDVAITMRFSEVPAVLTLHPGSRTTSYLETGDGVSAEKLAGATKVVRWYFINGLDVVAADTQHAAAVLGDSITDGYGTTTDHNNRWTDGLVQRLQSNPVTAGIGLLNEGIGGNRLLRDGNGPNALARFDRDVLAQTNVRWLIILEGVNDLGTGTTARKHGEPFASAAEIIGALEQLILRARTHGLKVMGGTITPFAGHEYFSPESEAARREVNNWIRTSGQFDAVIDFDAALRDSKIPDRLAAEFDCGDHLHPSVAGYQRMADAVDLALFAGN